MKPRKTILAAALAAAAVLALPQSAQAQSGDPILRFLNSIFPDAEFRSASESRNWNDDDDDGGSSDRWDDDDDDGSSGGRDDDDDDGGGRDDNDDDD